MKKEDSKESLVPSVEIADVVKVSPRVTQSQTNLVTEEAKPYQDETENKTAISGTKNLKPATKTGSGVNSS